MTVRQEHLEEFLELCWTAGEDGLMPLDRDRIPARLVCFLPNPIEPEETAHDDVITVMLQQGLLIGEGRLIRLSAVGRAKAQEIVRRHRLTEVLLGSVLEVSETSVESTACQAEHILNAEVTEAVCVFLGHPERCPHGRAIPRGACCTAAQAAVQPLLVPLARLAIGDEATVMAMQTKRREYLQRLHAFGVAPGRRIRLRQLQPSLVIQVDETQLALDHQAGQEIIVRRRTSPPRRQTA